MLVASVLVLAGVAANGLLATVPTAQAELALTPAGAGTVTVQARLTPAPAGPAWVQVTAWQGGGLVVDRLERTGPGTYRSTVPVPVTGTWKTLLRVHDGRELAAAPIFLPADAEIGATEVPAAARATRPLVPEITLLQRERALDVPGWLWALSSLVVLACSLALVAGLSWGVGRLSRRVGDRAAARGPHVARPSGAGLSPAR